MTNHTRSATAVETDGFSPNIYRRYNIDLQGMTDAELEAHFRHNQHEPRIFGNTQTTSEFLSMRWLRGAGLEIGAGRHPTPLFGNAVSLQSDCDPGLAFGGKSIDLQGNVDDGSFASTHASRFDFVVASHVLEHADSFLRALENMCILARAGGVVYVVLPDIRFLHDHRWMPQFDFEHHVQEYASPLCFGAVHDELYVEASSLGAGEASPHATLPQSYSAALKSRVIAPGNRFIHHKHNYDFDGWLELFQRARVFLANRFEFAEVRYGHERLDCHFVLKTRP